MDSFGLSTVELAVPKPVSVSGSISHTAVSGSGPTKHDASSNDDRSVSGSDIQHKPATPSPLPTIVLTYLTSLAESAAQFRNSQQKSSLSQLLFLGKYSKTLNQTIQKKNEMSRYVDNINANREKKLSILNAGDSSLSLTYFYIGMLIFTFSSSRI